MEINKGVIVQPQVREWSLRTQHPEHPELVGFWLDFKGQIDNEDG